MKRCKWNWIWAIVLIVGLYGVSACSENDDEPGTPNTENPDKPGDGNEDDKGPDEDEPLEPGDPSAPGTKGGKQVIGYLTQWDAWKGTEHGMPQAGVANQLNIDYSKYTILNYSFFGVAKDGSLHSGDYRNKNIWMEGTVQDPKPLLGNVYDSWDHWLLYGDLELVHDISEWNQDKLKGEYKSHADGWIHTPTGLTGEFPIPLPKQGGAKGLFELAKENNVRVMASIGGWSMCRHFPEMARSASKRERFIEDCKTLIRMGFDGIDIDWEYPGPYAGMNFTGSQADFANFTTLMEELREAIGPNRLLTAAFNCSPTKLQGFNWNKLNATMDFFNIMSYDIQGGWSNIAGHNSPLYPYTGEEGGDLAWDTSRKALEAAGVDMSKVNMGVALYGRSVVTTGSAKLNAPTVKISKTIQPDGAIQTAADYDNFGQFDGTPFNSYIRSNTANWTEHWDDEAKVPYKTNGKYFLSYENEKSVALKAQYVKDHNLGGVIFWEVFSDIDYGPVQSVYDGKLRQTGSNRSPLVEKIVSEFGG
ncbi:hypothetical protein FUAX_01060 [Fulvitalea axinellae]|uniref:chitinase n=1 Tax=Fulvitalea axinellae TaxID=1182444 RepID=A0AAU9CMX1_9BACT|nr:hypothetical protein FUAX_01060 [Fulvitalea axinellae]